MKELLSDLLSLVTNGAPSKAQDITERVLLANVQPSASPAFAAVNEVELFKALQSILDALKIQLRNFTDDSYWVAHLSAKISVLRWLLEKLFALQVGDVAIKTFSEEQELAHLVITRAYTSRPFIETFFCILERLLQALQSGEVVIPTSVRLAFVTTWLPVVARVINYSNEISGDDGLQIKLEEGLRAVIGTLPMADQGKIFKIWIKQCLVSQKAFPDLSTTFDSCCDKMRQARKGKDLQRGTSHTDETLLGSEFL